MRWATSQAGLVRESPLVFRDWVGRRIPNMAYTDAGWHHRVREAVRMQAWRIKPHTYNGKGAAWDEVSPWDEVAQGFDYESAPVLLKAKGRHTL